jgi:hypothetical protein
MVNGGDLGCSLRSGSRVRRSRNGSGNQVRWREGESGWLL